MDSGDVQRFAILLRKVDPQFVHEAYHLGIVPIVFVIFRDVVLAAGIRPELQAGLLERILVKGLHSDIVQAVVSGNDKIEYLLPFLFIQPFHHRSLPRICQWQVFLPEILDFSQRPFHGPGCSSKNDLFREWVIAFPISQQVPPEIQDVLA